MSQQQQPTETDDVATEALLEFLNACEAGVAAAKQRIKEAKTRSEKEPIHESWDPSKIVWVDTRGGRGLYQKSQDVNSVDFKALLRCLQGHHGKMTKDGFFMWVFQDGATIGRKKRS